MAHPSAPSAKQKPRPHSSQPNLQGFSGTKTQFLQFGAKKSAPTSGTKKQQTLLLGVLQRPSAASLKKIIQKSDGPVFQPRPPARTSLAGPFDPWQARSTSPLCSPRQHQPDRIAPLWRTPEPGWGFNGPEETTVAGIVARMVDLYPDWGNLRTLWHSSRTAVAKKG